MKKGLAISVFLSLTCSPMLSGGTPARPEWPGGVWQELRISEYGFSPSDDAVSAPNRAHNLRARISREGLLLTARDGTGEPWQLGLRATALESGREVVRLRGEVPRARGNRADVRRGVLTEWYVNEPRGLEQGFTLSGPAAPGDDAGWVRLEMAVAGSLRARLEANAVAVTFLTHDGQPAVRYGDLSVIDARGRRLPARLSLEGTRLSIGLETRGAAYPIIIDPLMTSPSWTASGQQPGAGFGGVVASAGDVNGDGYDDVLVTAFQYDNGQTNEGRAYAFLGSSTGLQTTPAWIVESNQSFAEFGKSAASAGDVNGDGYDDVLIGADLYDNGQADEGRAFLYLGSASGLSTTPAWTGESDAAGAAYGFSLGSAGDVNGDGYSDVIVGAFRFGGNLGRAYVYLGSAGGLSTSPAWNIIGAQSSAEYGVSVGTAGDVNGDGFSDVIVGSNHFSNGQQEEGRAFVYLGSAMGLSTIPSWTAESDQAFSQFGFGSARTAGDVNGDGFSDVIVGALHFTNGQSDEGRAYVFLGSASGLSAAPAWIAESDQQGAEFGRSAATAGDVNGDGFDDVVVGAVFYDNGQADEGRAYVYLGSSSGLSASPAWTAEPDLQGAMMGISVDSAGDVNGDGIDDVIAGAFRYESAQAVGGVAYVYLGAEDVCTPEPEACDGLDNDCDGDVDNGFDVGAPCSAGVGACLRTGVKVCNPNGVGTSCSAVAGAPSPEACDGIDNDCDGTVDDNAIEVQAVASISPTTLNVNSQGSSFMVNLALTDVCDPANAKPIDGRLLDRAWVSRAGNYTLPDPASITCPAPNGDILFERGIVDDMLSRGVTNNSVSLKFTLPSDGDCRTFDGDRQDLIALLVDVLDNQNALICVSSAVTGIPFEACTSAIVKNRGNR